MASSVEQQIRNAGERNSQLLETLASTDGAASALAQHQRFQQDLQDQLKQSNQRLQKLQAQRQRRLSEHEKYRDSHVRRFMFKASGKREKFAQRAEDGEREYFKVLQDAQQEQSIHAAITAQAQEAQRAEAELQAHADQHDAAHKELDALYAHIFDGPTPQFPEEDAREQRYQAALHAHRQTRGRFDAETQAVAQLNLADRAMTQALYEVAQALGYSRMDMFGSGGAMSDMMERSHLARADGLARMARAHAERARRLSSEVGELPAVRINQGNIMSDVFFDNFITDYAFHQEIRRGQQELKRCYDSLQHMGDAADARRRELEAQLGRQVLELKTARADLQRAREEVFRLVLRREAGGGGGNGGNGEGGGHGTGDDLDIIGVAEAPRRIDSLPPAYDAVVEGDAAPAYDAGSGSSAALNRS
ncbi:hypothetical protein BB8028_0001g08670 [Beauveria bassiana]|uniref:Uncharacterized protein n=1 Tax=Beauveria bassiana TaxID=176275 RepID=A0A2S7XYB1_BEABA|nr:hypothetical protein BB8028_0001g08670 [Beauveria bassiana]